MRFYCSTLYKDHHTIITASSEEIALGKFKKLLDEIGVKKMMDFVWAKQIDNNQNITRMRSET